MSDVANDPNTLLIALADRGGGGVVSNDHESDHPLDRTIPLILFGGTVAWTSLTDASLLDAPSTVV